MEGSKGSRSYSGTVDPSQLVASENTTRGAPAPEHTQKMLFPCRGDGGLSYTCLGCTRGDSWGWPSCTPTEHAPDCKSDLLLVPSVTSEPCCLLPALPEGQAQAAQPASPSLFLLFIFKAMLC